METKKIVEYDRDIVAVAKMGRTIKFKRDSWRDNAGNNEPAVLISALSKLNPLNTYIVIGRSDLSKLSTDEYNYLFPNANVLDAFKGFNKNVNNVEMYPYENTSSMDFDYGIIIGGVASRINMRDKFYKINKKTKKAEESQGLISPLNMFHSYAAPIINLLNITDIPWVFYTSDARQVPIGAYDLINREILTLGTMNMTYTSKYFSGEGFNGQNVITDEKEMHYAGGELVSILDNKIKRYNGEEKTINLGLFFHKYNDKKRYENILGYINEFEDISVFGKWKEEIESGDERFKGSLTFDETQDMMKKTKYTLCYPITDGDISAKWIEAIRAGVIPFFAPEYDKDKLLSSIWHVPSFLYLSSREDLKSKINYLNDNEENYKTIINQLKDIYDLIKNNYANIIDFTIKESVKKDERYHV